MMPSTWADAGHASRLDSLQMALNLQKLGVEGDGCIRVDESRASPSIYWSAKRHSELTLLSQDNDQLEGALQDIERFNAEVIAIAGKSDPVSDAGHTETSQDQLDIHSREEELSQSKYAAYLTRLKYLQDAAAHDGFTLNLASEIDFRNFIRSAPDFCRGNLVLLDNGNLRAIWKDGDGTRLGLQFLGGRMVQYVIFKRRKQGQPISRVSGRDTIEGLMKQVVTFELNSLLCV